MSEFSRDLVDLLTVREKDSGLFIGDTEAYGVSDRLYGGHFLAQSLSAGFQTVEAPKLAHSCHAYFHLKGDDDKQVEYQVETLREGRSFSSRRITARQNDQIVFSMTASFKTKDEDEFFQPPMPQVESLEDAIERRMKAGFGEAKGPPAAGGRIEIQPLYTFKTRAELEEGEERSNRFQSWLRLAQFGEQRRELNERQQQLLQAFVSDGPMPFCSVILHGDHFGTHQHMSLDHSIWFHQPGDLNEWLLLDSVSVGTADGRGLNDGWLFSNDGKLLTSMRQESLMRKIKGES